MAIISVNKDNFKEEVLESDKKVLIDFYADWCGPCKMLAPVVEKIAEEKDDIKVVKVDIDKESELATKYQIMSIPTLVVIHNGEVINQNVGLCSKQELMKLL